MHAYLLIPDCSQPAKQVRYFKDLAFAASDAKAYLTAADNYISFLFMME